MMHAKSDSDVTSLSPSSPRSPKRPVYYVQSPSRDSNDGDKSSTMQATPAFNSPMESPSHPSYGRHSRASSASRVSGTFRSSSGQKGTRKRNDKGWPECNVIEEEGDYGGLFKDKGISRRCQIWIALFGFVVIFSFFCLILWGASRPYKARVAVKSHLRLLKLKLALGKNHFLRFEGEVKALFLKPRELVELSFAVHNFYFGEGSDTTGVPSKMLTMNCSVKMSVYNPATFFGIHVGSTPINLMYSEIAVATGQLKKYYQPRKSYRNVTVNLQGIKVPLYGAGASLAVSDNSGGVPMMLMFEVQSRGNVVGKLVRSKHRRHISCSMEINSHNSKPIKLKTSSCTYK